MPAITTVTASGNQDIDGMMYNAKWAVSSFTFSFPTNASFYQAGSAPNGETTNNFAALNATQQDYVRTYAYAQYEAVANLTFSEMTETLTDHADLRFALTDAYATAFGYYPATAPYAGGTWYENSSGQYDNPIIGNYAAHTFMHEIGHTLGLLHGFDTSNPFGALPEAHDSVEYSIMTYVSFVGGPSTGGYTYAAASAPQTLMQNDIATLQHLYGANYSTNSGDTVYSWNPSTGRTFVDGVSTGPVAGNRIFMTVWDGGGNDTYDLSAYSSDMSIDLQPGAWSTFNTSAIAQRAFLGGGGHIAAGNVANALLYNGNTQSLIENVVGGSGNDTIVGNVVSNDLKGGAGNDILNGLGAADVLTGGAGADTFQLDATLFAGSRDQIVDYSLAASDVIDLSSFVSATAADLSSYVKVLQSGSGALLVVDQDGAGSTYGWVTIAQIDNVSLGDDIELLIGPSSTVMTTEVTGNSSPNYSVTAADQANQYDWSSRSATYNNLNQILNYSVDYDDGTHSSTIYDAPSAELYSDFLVTYDGAWGATRIIFEYDDGTRTVASYDVANQYSYADYLATFDSQWNLTRNIFVNDDGTKAVVDYDVQNQYAWTWLEFDYDANWNLISSHGQNDDGSSFGNGYVGPGVQGGEGATQATHALAPDEMPPWAGAAGQNSPTSNDNGSVGSGDQAGGTTSQNDSSNGPSTHHQNDWLVS